MLSAHNPLYLYIAEDKRTLLSHKQFFQKLYTIKESK